MCFPECDEHVRGGVWVGIQKFADSIYGGFIQVTPKRPEELP